VPFRSSVVLRGALLGGALVWAGVIPLAAFAATRPGGVPAAYGFALVAYSMGRVICHQLPVRSFHLWGVALPVCARCTGIYAGAAVVAVAVFVARATPVRTGAPGDMPSATTARRVLVAAMLPTALTLVFEWTTGAMPANWIRALAGFPIGAAATWLIARANPEP
jgi:uncharacterized membrane protein